MGKRTLTRRRFGLGAGTIAVAGLAGCLGDDGDDNGDDNGEENGGENNSDDDDENRSNDGGTDPDTGTLTITLENEDGDPVSEGVEVSLQGEEMSYTLNSFEEGEAEQSGVLFGEYDVTVSSTAEEPEFDPIEETFQMEEEEQELSYTLEGATGDDSGNETDE